MGKQAEGILNHMKVLGVALLAAALVSAVMLLSLGLLCYKLDLKENTAMIGIFATYALACLLGGFVCGKLQECRSYAWGMVLGGAYFLVLLVLSVLFGAENAGPDKNPVSIFMVCEGFGLLGGMLGGMKK